MRISEREEHLYDVLKASFLRKIVAGPRAPHAEADLDLCYVTDNIIATSGPSSSYPSRAYRNPLPQLVRFLDQKHGPHWAIWEFRAEGTGYPDSEVYNRVFHYPWPDHHPPPFKVVPSVMSTMRDWLNGEDIKGDRIESSTTGTSSIGAMKEKEALKKKRVVVVHCKAGKGRSGSMATSYLLSEEGWTKEEALQRFTERRMRPGFGAGVSIPSQLRWLVYVEQWAKGGKLYVEQAVEVLEVHVWGLREGVKIGVDGYIDGGKTIKTFHVFEDSEKDDADGGRSNQRDRSGTGPGSREEATTPSVQARTASPANRFRDVVGEAMRKKRGEGSRTSSRAPSSTRQPSSNRSTPASSITNDDKSSTYLSPRTSDAHGNVITATTTITQTFAPRNPSSSGPAIQNTTSTSRPTSKPQPAVTNKPSATSTPKNTTPPNGASHSPAPSRSRLQSQSQTTPTRTSTVYRPHTPIHIPTNDINLTVQRRAHASYGFTMVTSIAHVWFNCFFEGGGSDRLNSPDDSYSAKSSSGGVFEIDWDAMDGLKGSSKKGARAFDRVAVVWRVRKDTAPETDPVPRESFLDVGDSSTGYSSMEDETRSSLGGVAGSIEEEGAGVVIKEPELGEALRAGRPPGVGLRPEGDRRGKSRSLNSNNSGSEFDEDGAEGIRRGVREM